MTMTTLSTVNDSYRNNIKKAFSDYVSDYNASDPKISLKIAHTYRVAELCDTIAHSIKLTDEDVNTAWTIGMLHDIARFEQVRKYGTFNDAESVDHAEYGVKLLFEDGLIDLFDIDSKYYSVISNAIKNHNKYRIPDGLSSNDVIFCKIIRDADKIDILRVNYETPMEEIYNTTHEILVNDSISNAVYSAFFENSAINHKIKETMIDRLVGHISLCFEFEYPISRKITLDQGYLQKLLSFNSNVPETNQRLRVISDYILNFLTS